ncbi:hypothetical protein ACFE04_019752 [Oxalis oulophora]
MEQDRRRNPDPSAHRDSPKKKDRHRPSYKSIYTKPSMYPYEPVSEFSVGQWNLRGQRLYPAMSDSAVCSYPFPNEFSMNPTFPMYPVLPPTMYSVGLESNRRSNRYRRKSKAPDMEANSNNSANFTSLPPVNNEDIDCSQKRRFSDPGLNNAEESNDSSSSESISDECSLVNESLVEQITELKSENKRLHSELESTRTELKLMRSEIAVVANKVSCHEPFSLARKFDRLISTSIVGEIDSLKKRLTMLERQLDHLRIHSKVDSKVNGEATTDEIEIATKRINDSVDKISKLQNSIEHTKERDCNSNTTATFDANSDVVAESSSDCNGNSLSTISCESLSSSLGPGSLHSATVTLCGPVTDL